MTKKVKEAAAAASSDKSVDPAITKPDSFVYDLGTLPVQIRRSVSITGKPVSQLTVELKLNFKKNHFTVLPKLDNDQLTGDEVTDAATLSVLMAATKEAIERGLKWRAAREAAASKDNDPDQIELGFS